MANGQYHKNIPWRLSEGGDRSIFGTCRQRIRGHAACDPQSYRNKGAGSVCWRAQIRRRRRRRKSSRSARTPDWPHRNNRHRKRLLPFYRFEKIRTVCPPEQLCGIVPRPDYTVRKIRSPRQTNKGSIFDILCLQRCKTRHLRRKYRVKVRRQNIKNVAV